MEFVNWFDSTGKDNFENYLSHLKGLPNMDFLQLGVYTGDASVWLLENILTDETSTLHDVDTWQGSDEEAHESIDFNEVYKYYKNRTKQYKNLRSYKLPTMTHLRYDLNKYDFIYIDADHTAIGVLLDAELSWDLLKKNGIMAFDDYEWRGKVEEHLNPKPGINSFIDRHRKELDIIHIGWQFWIVKK